MRKSFIRAELGFIVATAFMASACQMEPDGFEYDDTWERAWPISLDERQSRSLHSFSDVDFIHFRAEPGEFYAIETHVEHSNADTLMAVTDSLGNILDYNDDYMSLGSRVSLYSPHGGTYFIIVDRYEGSAIGAYDLEVKRDDSIDAFEPDNRIEDAGFIEAGQFQRRNLHHGSDRDYIRFDGVASGIYRATTEIEMGTMTDTVLYLLGPNGETLAFNDDQGYSAASALEFEIQETGPHYLLVEPWSYYSYPSAGAYELQFEWVNAQDFVDEEPVADEPGDDPVVDTPGDEPGDEPSDDPVVDTPGDEPGDEPSDDPVIDETPDDDEPSDDPVGDDPDEGDEPGGVGAIRPDAFEPDNARNSASYIKFGVPQARTLHAGTDVDHIRFEAERDVNYCISATVPDGAATDPIVVLTDKYGRSILEGDINQSGGSVDLEASDLPDGTLYLQIAPYSREHLGAYTLKLDRCE